MFNSTHKYPLKFTILAILIAVGAGSTAYAAPTKSAPGAIHASKSDHSHSPTKIRSAPDRDRFSGSPLSYSRYADNRRHHPRANRSRHSNRHYNSRHRSRSHNYNRYRNRHNGRYNSNRHTRPRYSYSNWRGPRSYGRSNYRSGLGISFSFGTPGYSRYRWAPTAYSFYQPSYTSYNSYQSSTQCRRVELDGWHNGHAERVSVLQCTNPWNGSYIVEGTEHLIDCRF